MKRILLAVLLAAVGLTVTACAAKPTLHLLNWGDYIDLSLVDAFEREYGVRVVNREVGSNEEMATLLQSGSSDFDLVVPSDYMIDKLASIGLLQPIDPTRLVNDDELTIMPRLSTLYQDQTWSEYAIPYAWGTIGILYDTRTDGLAADIAAHGWAVLFESAGVYDVGMYDSPRDAVGAALLYRGFDVNTEDAEELAAAETALTGAGFAAWGEDSLKSLVIGGTLDLALVYSGDYFSEYYAALADDREVTFDYYVPQTTNVWLDALCIPSTADAVDLAYAFIDFMLEFDHALANSDYIGYASPWLEVYTTMTEDPDYGYDFPTFDPFPEGSSRQFYRYGSDAHSEALVAIVNRAKSAR